MKLEKAIELLQGDTFAMEESFYSELGGDVTAEYTLIVLDAQALLEDLQLDLDNVDDYNSLYDMVEDGLNSHICEGVAGVI